MSSCMCGGCERCQPAGALDVDDREWCGECGELVDECECVACPECSEPNAECMCPCPHCLRIGNACACDDRAEPDLDDSPESLDPWGGDR